MTSKDQLQRTSLWHAVSCANEELVQTLLEGGENPSSKDIFGVSPLRKGILKGCAPIVKLLLDKMDPEPSSQDYGRYWLDENDYVNELPNLCWAAASGNLEIMKLLFDHKAYVNVIDRYKRTPLHHAITNEKTDAVDILLDHWGIDVRPEDENGIRPLHLAVSKNSIRMTNALLVHKGIDVNDSRPGGATPLWLAISEGHNEIVKRLLTETKLNLNITAGSDLMSFERRTVLQLAVQKDDMEVVKWLLADERLSINSVASGQSALACAVSVGNIEMVKLLLEQEDIDIDVRGRLGSTPLWLAASSGRFDLVQLLLQRTDNIDVNRFDVWEHKNALMVAAKRGDLETVKLLLALDRTDPNLAVSFPAKSKETALEFAALGGHFEVVKALLSDPRLDCDLGLPALHAKYQGHDEVERIITDEREKRHSH